jgi:HEXXH motif-containing protein
LNGIKLNKVKSDLSVYLALCRKITASDLPEPLKADYRAGREAIGAWDVAALTQLFQCPITVWCVSSCVREWAQSERMQRDNGAISLLIDSLSEAVLHFNRVVMGVALMRSLTASLDCVVVDGFVHLQPCGFSVPASGVRARVTVTSERQLEVGGVLASASVTDAAHFRCAPTWLVDRELRIEAFDPLMLKHWTRKAIFPYVTSAQAPDENELVLWVQKARRNFERLQLLWPGMAVEILSLQTMLVPVKSPPNGLSISLSSDDFWGCILLSDADEILFNESLIHEHSHSVMYGLLREHAMLVSGGFDGDLYYSPWRSDARPLYGLLHAVYVFSRVCEYYALLVRECPHDVALLVRLALMNARVDIGCIVLTESHDLTAQGVALVESIRTQSDRLRSLYGDASVQRLKGILNSHLKEWLQTHPGLQPAAGVLEYHLLDLAGAAQP